MLIDLIRIYEIIKYFKININILIVKYFFFYSMKTRRKEFLKKER